MLQRLNTTPLQSSDQQNSPTPASFVEHRCASFTQLPPTPVNIYTTDKDDSGTPKLLGDGFWKNNHRNKSFFNLFKRNKRNELFPEEVIQQAEEELWEDRFVTDPVWSEAVKKGVQLSHHWDVVETTVKNKVCTWQIHSLVCKLKTTNYRSSQGKVLLIHGTASNSSCAFPKILPKLALEGKYVQTFDIPGFGRSSAPKILLELNSEEISRAFADVLHKWLRLIQRNKDCMDQKQFVNMKEWSQKASETKNKDPHPDLFVLPKNASMSPKVPQGKWTVVSHSFGTVLAVCLAAYYPDVCVRLILTSPASLLPTTYDHGLYWAIFFRMGGPQNLLRRLGKTGFKALSALAQMNPCDLNTQYWYLSQSSPIAFGHWILTRYCTWMSTKFAIYWNMPQLHMLLGLEVPVTLVYGRHDSIVPAEHAKIIRDISNCQIETFVLEAGHSVSIERPDGVVDIVCNWLEDRQHESKGEGDAKGEDIELSEDMMNVLGSMNRGLHAAKDLEEEECVQERLESTVSGEIQKADPDTIEKIKHILLGDPAQHATYLSLQKTRAVIAGLYQKLNDAIKPLEDDAALTALEDIKT